MAFTLIFNIAVWASSLVKAETLNSNEEVKVVNLQEIQEIDELKDEESLGKQVEDKLDVGNKTVTNVEQDNPQDSTDE